MSKRPVFIVSDRSGLTAETLCHTLLSQFPGVDFQQRALPFVDSDEKLQQAMATIRQAATDSGQRPLVFTTFVDESIGGQLATLEAEIFDLFEPFIGRMEKTLDQMSSHQAGQSHGIANEVQYAQRINAVNFAMHCDDGLHTRDYDTATLILLGPSRSGKTPTCLYLALHFGFYVGNYPLTEEDFSTGELPGAILEHKNKTFGLTIEPRRLHQIRTERRPGSEYASIGQCRQDVARAEALYRAHKISFCDSTNYSVEELGSTIKHQMGLQSTLY